jgi:hypothetical protein
MPGPSKEEQLIKVLLATQKLVNASSVSKAEIKNLLHRLDTALTILTGTDASKSPKRSVDGLLDEEAQELTTATPSDLEYPRTLKVTTPPTTGEEGHKQQQRKLDRGCIIDMKNLLK